MQHLRKLHNRTSATGVTESVMEERRREKKDRPRKKEIKKVKKATNIPM
jgi:hypothetical protein